MSAPRLGAQPGKRPDGVSATASSGSAPTSQALTAAVLNRAGRWRSWEVAFFFAAVASWFVLPDRALLGNEIAILALFAVSLDLILGYAGIVSLGHTAFFGFGAYAAAILAKGGTADPTLGLLVATVAAALLGAVSSLLILRGSDLTRLMITLAVAAILFELANKLDTVTGGADGLQGVVMGPLLGRFEFDLAGRVAYGYSLTVLLVTMLVVRRVLRSPFGASLKALRDNRLRASSIGISVASRLIVVYTLGAALAGTAGALLAQTSGFASLDVLEFHRSADVLLVLVIGGTGYLYGGVFGAIAFRLLQEILSAWTPQYWIFWLGLFLVVLMLIGRERLVGCVTRGARRNAA